MRPDATQTNPCTKSRPCLSINKFLIYSAEGFHVGCDWSRAVFSPDGQYVIAGSQDGALFVWNTNTNHVEKVLREHQ